MYLFHNMMKLTVYYKIEWWHFYNWRAHDTYVLEIQESTLYKHISYCLCIQKY